MSTQRRSYAFGTPDPSQNAFPRISAPLGTSSPFPDDDKRQRRALCVPHRIWVLFSVILFVFLCTRILSTRSGSISHRIPGHSKLVAVNHLNSSHDPEYFPFDFCPVYGPENPITAKYGAHALFKSKLHVGSGARVQRVISKALSGLPVTISIIGGSVSACHGAGDNPVSPSCYPSQFFQWWNDIFPNAASELTNGAMRRTSSAYFSFCHGLHIPDRTDLVVVELDSDDPNDREWLDHFELLVRSILTRPDSPAVIILGHFSPQVQVDNGFVGPEFLHTVVGQYYDVPHISTKPLLYSSHLRAPDTIMSYYADPVLANPDGHSLIADVLISYFQGQICAAWALVTGTGFDVPVVPPGSGGKGGRGAGLFGGIRKEAPENKPLRVGLGKDDASTSEHAPFRVPLARLSSRPSDVVDFRELRPFCVSANDLINPLPPSLFYGSGWHSYHPPKGAAYTEGGESAHYWYSTLPTSKLRVPMKMGAGDVAIYYWREQDSPTFASGVRCWVDDNVRGAIEIRNTGEGPPGPAIRIIDHSVTEGSHYVECELLGEEGHGVPPFKIMGIFST